MQEDQVSSPRSTASGGIDDIGIHHGVEQAVHMMWNNQYDDCESILFPKKDFNPRYALEYANIFLVKTLMNSTNESRELLLDLFKKADSLASSTKYDAPMFYDSDDDEEEGEEDEEGGGGSPRSKKLRKKNKKAFKQRRKAAAKNGERFDQTWQLECDVIYADALLIRSVGQLMMNSYIKGGINLRKTWGCYHSLIQRVEKDTEKAIPRELEMCIKYGAGTFYAFLALVPAGIMKLLNAIGFISDKELGEEYLTEVFESNTIRSPFAALVLLTFYLFLPTGLGNVEVALSKAKRILDVMNERYGSNTYFNGYANFYHRKRGETAEALQAIELSAMNAESAGLVPLLIRYLHADTLYMDLRFDAAKAGYTQLIQHLTKTKETFAYSGQVALSLAACYQMLGDDASALQWIQKVGSVYNPKSKNDANAPKWAARVLTDQKLLPLTGVYLLYINRDLAHMKEDQASRVLAELKRVTEGKDLSSIVAQHLYNLFVGVIEKGCGHTDMALTEFGKIFAEEKRIPQDTMVLPYAYYEAGEIMFRRKDYCKAKELFEKGQSFKGDGNETMANRYSIAMKQLKRAIAEES